MPAQPLHAIVRRQATYALTAFVGAALALETLVPGAVLPFLDIMPLAIAAGALLLYDATRRARSTRLPWVAVVIKLFFSVAIIAVALLLIPWSGRAGAVAAVVMALGVATLAFWPQK